MSLTEAVVIATRDRSDDLARTLTSLAHQEDAARRLVVVVDSSSEEAKSIHLRVLEQYPGPSRYVEHQGRPAGTRQRNAGIAHLPPGVQAVHFIDDDVTVLPGYFNHLTAVLQQYPEIGGVGGLIWNELQPAVTATPPFMQRLKQSFFLDGPLGSVLQGGVAVSAQDARRPSIESAAAIQWLSTCSSSYRRAVFAEFRFDETIEGASPRLEDLDFSYRVAQRWPLLVEPRAQIIHHGSPRGRRSPGAVTEVRLLRRWQFVQRHQPGLRSQTAFWWSVQGEVLALAASRHPEARGRLAGLLRAVRAILTGNVSHALLSDRGGTDGALRP